MNFILSTLDGIYHIKFGGVGSYAMHIVPIGILFIFFFFS